MAGRDLGSAGLSLIDKPSAGESPSPSAAPSIQSVYRQYFNFVWSSAQRFGAEAEALDDVVQEVFIVIHAKLPHLERPEALRSWIYGVVRRTVSTHRRARRARTAAGLSAVAECDAESPEPTPFERTKVNAELELLAKLLSELDEPKREIFELVELQELSVPEAADVLELPVNTAYSRLRAARQAFEAALARHGAPNRGR
jgi:RNA polymerase sigma-70 factor (ECF subfamily)